jgi:large subunit ribosomal protein L10
MASSGGLLLLQKDITIDLDQYRADISAAAREAIGLAVEAAYPTPETLPLIITKASRNALELAKESGYVTPENAESVIGFAEAQAKALFAAAEKKGFKAQS